MIVGIAALNGRDGDNEPVDMMVEVARQALVDCGSVSLRNRLQAVRVVKGIWPYRDPGALVAVRLELPATVRTGLTQIGGNEAYDLLNTTALEMQQGSLDAALICSAETMRSRRRDRAVGRRSLYREEPGDAEPDDTFGVDRRFWDEADTAAGVDQAVNFYAMAASSIRHTVGLSPEEFLRSTAALWARASRVAAGNPHAWMTDVQSAEHIATPSESNRLIAAPYPKLMTSNIDVDQAAAVVMCTADTARAAGIDPSRWVFPLSGSGGHDSWTTRCRWSLAESPALGIAGRRALDLAGLELADVTHLDLYSCFPAAVQTAQHELGIHEHRPFTITGGMTFAGGPFNSYCLHAYARAVELLRVERDDTAFMSGNGGFFTKHSFALLSASEPAQAFAYERPQADIDAAPRRKLMSRPGPRANIDAYTVTYDRAGEPDRGILSVLDGSGARTWATCSDRAVIDVLVSTDAVGRTVTLDDDPPVPTATSIA